MTVAVLTALALAGCKVNEDTRLTAIIGAVLIDGNGGPPITDSVVVVSGTRIRSAGLRANVPIPAGSDKINGSGKFLTPALVDLPSRDDARVGEKSDPNAARRRVGELAAKRASVVYLDSRSHDVIDAVMDEARKSNTAVTGYCTSGAEARYLVSAGVSGLVGTFGEELDSDFLSKLRDLKIVVAPILTNDQEKRNAKKMAAAGVLIGVADGQMEPLAEAGLSPLEITAAATRNAAMALHRLDQLGTIEAGKRADLLLLNANPMEDVRNFQKIDQVMRDGEWVDRAARTGK